MILLKTGDGSTGLPALDGRKATLSKAEEPTRNSRQKETVCMHLPDRMNKGATTWFHLLWPQPARGGTGRMLCQYTDRERDTSGFLLFPPVHGQGEGHKQLPAIPLSIDLFTAPTLSFLWPHQQTRKAREANMITAEEKKTPEQSPGAV